MKNKIVLFDADQREQMKVFASFKESVNTVDPKEIESAFLYLSGKGDPIHMSVLNPNWELIGRLKVFLRQLEEDFYNYEFGEPLENMEH